MVLRPLRSLELLAVLRERVLGRRRKLHAATKYIRSHTKTFAAEDDKRISVSSRAWCLGADRFKAGG